MTLRCKKKLEQSIRESELRWRSIVDGAPFPIVITRESDNIIMLVNQRTLQTFNVTTQDLIGKTTDRFYGNHETRETVLDTLQNTEALDDAEMKMKTIDGREFWVYASIRKIHYLDQNALFISFADFTNRKILEDTLTAKNRELELLSESLAETNKKLNLLSSITRHDILNKIQVIATLSEIITQDNHHDEVLQKRIGMIAQAGNDIQALIEFTGEYQNLGQTAPEWVDITQVLKAREMISIVPGVTIKTPERAIEIYADPMLRKVFFNLIDNSIRHGGFITTIHIDTREEGSDLTIIYEDDGNGIPDEEKTLIFTRGYGQNTGLGLFFIREILKMTGMTITETGVLGTGARFVIRVPSGRFRYP